MAKVVNLEIDQGATFSVNVAISLATTNNYSANAQIRKHPGSNTSVAFTANIVNTTVLMLSLSAGALANVESGKYVYDATLRESVANTVIRAVEGSAFINASVTK